MILHAFSVALTLIPAANPSLVPDSPSPSELLLRYSRTNETALAYRRLAFRVNLNPTWIGKKGHFWYETVVRGEKHFWLVTPEKANKESAFDHQRLADALADSARQKMQSGNLPFDSVSLDEPGGKLQFEYANKTWTCNLQSYELTSEPKIKKPQRPAEPWVQSLWPPDAVEQVSPDHRFRARIVRENVVLQGAKSTPVGITADGKETNYYARLTWAPNGKSLIATRVIPGDRKKVYLIQSTPEKWGPAVLKERVYDRAGDRVDAFTMETIDPETGKVAKVGAEPVDYGEMPNLRWLRDGRHFTYEKTDRGYGRYRVIKVDSLSGVATTIIDEHPNTFVDSTSQFIYYGKNSDEMVYRSERDGFGRLYLVSPDGKMQAMSPERWVVREVVDVNEKDRRVIFAASGMNPDEDPYFIHYYSVGFDGSNLTSLTPARGNHSANFSEDHRWLVDGYSQVDVPPVHELRNAQGDLVMALEHADIADLSKAGFRLPEPFTAKGRDGKTDIYGVIYRPSTMDPNHSYPILEDIYAGPQDSFVPKSFGVMGWDHAMAELGFIVVKIDGMGTRNRGKAFQDVCYKNLADAGFPDGILWMKALHAKYPYADINRVGAYGTSAGGQSAGGSVLFHPEFYKAAVASCGCHDNRLDKVWWNEQWMGRLGPHYASQSNITNASKLKGSLLLIVGELDTNVPPESTYRYAAALQAANKEYELVVIPNSDHTSGGAFGERKRRDFFVRKLIGVEPPAWNR